MYLCDIDLISVTDSLNFRQVVQQTGGSTDRWFNRQVVQQTDGSTDRWFNSRQVVTVLTFVFCSGGTRFLCREKYKNITSADRPIDLLLGDN